VPEPRVGRVIYVTHKKRDCLEASGGAEIYLRLAGAILASVREKRKGTRFPIMIQFED
jgi:hypothetical protein